MPLPVKKSASPAQNPVAWLTGAIGAIVLAVNAITDAVDVPGWVALAVAVALFLVGVAVQTFTRPSW